MITVKLAETYCILEIEVVIVSKDSFSRSRRLNAITFFLHFLKN